MSSAIDPTVPSDNTKPEKALFRQNFQAAKDEIEELQNKSSYTSKLAYDEAAFDNL